MKAKKETKGKESPRAPEGGEHASAHSTETGRKTSVTVLHSHDPRIHTDASARSK